ncbi:MAG TPA: hypothetical protein VHZ25_04005 [Acidobacteriaceae bacterium]|nr:hypothetical protein [Acidobacteriaceae bacterium]
MPKQPQQPIPEPRPAPAATGRSKPLREQLHEAVNANIAQTVKQGLDSIDQLKVHAIADLERRGITGMEEIGESAADLVKRLLLRGISK